MLVNKGFSILLLSFLCLSCLASQTRGERRQTPYQYTVTAVLDGDTITVTDGNASFRVRLAALDAPEYQQKEGKENNT